MNKKITVKDIIDKKNKEKIAVLTAYDYPFALFADHAQIDIVLVGDSLGMVCLGYESTLPVTMREMLHHTKAVGRAVKRALIVADMPFGSYRHSAAQAVRNALRLLKEGGADAVKLEGGKEILDIVRALRTAGIPVMGHVGLMPQSATEQGGYKYQGKTPAEAGKIKEDALLLREAGIFSLVLECLPLTLAQDITRALDIPVIGIGSGVYCDGQVLVMHDLLGLKEGANPRFARQYADLRTVIERAMLDYRNDVLAGHFPSLEESFSAQASGREQKTALPQNENRA